MTTLPQLTWPGLPGPPQGPLPVSPPIPPDETGTPPKQLPLEPARPKAPQPEFAATTEDQTPYPSHAHYGSEAVVVATARAALGPGAPVQRWWAGMDEEAIYLSGLPAVSRPAPPTPPYSMPFPTPPVFVEPPPVEPPPIVPPVEPPPLDGRLLWFDQPLVWYDQILVWN